jgi:hypothetical protein
MSESTPALILNPPKSAPEILKAVTEKLTQLESIASLLNQCTRSRPPREHNLQFSLGDPSLAEESGQLAEAAYSAVAKSGSKKSCAPSTKKIFK